MKNLLKEFKSFIAKGNVLDLAVAVIIGNAFGAIVKSLVDDLLMPIIGIIIGGKGVQNWSVSLGTAVVKYGNFIQTIINFLIIGFILFMIIKIFNTMNKKMSKKKEEEKEEPVIVVDEKAELLKEIRDLLKNK